jgi:hypothetical protein
LKVALFHAAGSRRPATADIEGILVRDAQGIRSLAVVGA